MTDAQLTEYLSVQFNKDNLPFSLNISPNEKLQVYPNSIARVDEVFFFIARSGKNKWLYLISPNGESSIVQNFHGEIRERNSESPSAVKCCPLNHDNAILIQKHFEFTRPALIGLKNSIGLGCRLGLANPGHLRAVAGNNMAPVLAQQSIRELTRTDRKPEEVMDAAVWAVFQEGYKAGFGADADHLKTTQDIDLMVRAGFTMLTFDPGDQVVDEADVLQITELNSRARFLPWTDLEDSLESVFSRYESKTFHCGDDLTIRPSEEEILRAVVKYGAALAHNAKLYRYLKRTYPDYSFELEISVDETESVTTPFEHLLIANELRRLGIEIVSLAPRFVGEFEKGIEYRGNLGQFKEEYIKHQKIAQTFGPYKISFHSGSDKFSVYQAVGGINQGSVHVKTAGTSYLEALRTIACKEPELFREILDFSRNNFQKEKKTYHVSAELEKVPSSAECSNEQLVDLCDMNHARQVLHVTFGRVLTDRNKDGAYIFRQRILSCLKAHEETYSLLIKNHFLRHVQPFI